MNLHGVAIVRHAPPMSAASGSAEAGAGRFPGCTHGRAAFTAALEDGLLSGEVAQILGGRRIVDAFPVRRGESPPVYAARAVGEMMVAYLR